VGVITIEDVIEELLGAEIVDETDLYVDNQQTSRVDAGGCAAVWVGGVGVYRDCRRSSSHRKRSFNGSYPQPQSKHSTSPPPPPLPR